VKGKLVVVDLYPSLLQPEGDRGNPLVLAHRARAYGVDASVVVVHPGDDVPAADLVCLGGSEDSDLTVAAERLREAEVLPRLVDGGAVVFGVGAGYALLGHELVSVDGSRHAGTGALDVVLHEAPSLLSGPVLTRPVPDLGLPPVTGYEYHRQMATCGSAAERWLDLEVGSGDGGVAGARQGWVVGTWTHGPVLPRNPELADLLLRWAGVEVDPAGCPEDQIARDVREQRMSEARR
jgi:CobQ-like glutamine amidotransferase family enzyme